MEHEAAAHKDERDTIVAGELLLDLHAKSAQLAGRPLDLTAREFQLLAHFAEHPGWVYSPEQLLREVWEYEYVGDCRLVYTHIGNLRRKLEQEPSGRGLICTVRGVGYRLANPEQAPPSPPAATVLQGHAHRVTEQPLVGRSQEMALLVEALEQAGHGCGSLVLVLGEAGQGKTRLAEEVAARAETAGAAAFWARCQAATSTSAYWPWIQLLRPLARLLAGEDQHGSAMHGAAELAQVIPEIGECFPGLPSPRTPLLVDVRLRFFDAVATFLQEAAARTRLLLVLEDLDYCDLESLLLLQTLAPQLHDSAILILATLDEIALGRDRPLGAVVSALAAAGCPLLRLSGLPASAVGELARLATGADITSGLVESLIARTGGNPFFVIELLRSMSAEGAAESASVPRAIRNLVEARLDHLAPQCRELLALAALLGRSFRLPILQAASGLSAAAAVDLLDEALTAELIEPAGTPGTFRFSHPLLPDVLVAYLGEARRLSLHAQACAAYEALFDTEDVLDELAYHSYHASPFVDGAKAVDFSRRAGERALGQCGFEAAARHFKHALVLLPLDGSPAESHHLAAVVLREALGDAQLLNTRLEEALTAYREALALAPPADRLRRARLRRKMASAWQAQQAPRDALESLDAAERVLAAAEAELDGDEWNEWIEIQLRRMESLYFQGDLDGLQAAIARSAERIAQHGTAAQELDFRTQHLALEFRRERYRISERTETLARDLLRTVVATDDLPRLCRATYQLGFALLWRGTLVEAQHYLRECREEAVYTHDRRHLVLSDTYLAVVERLSGHVDETEGWAREAEADAGAASLPGYVAAARANQAWVALCRGNPHTAEQLARLALGAWATPSAFPFEWLARWPLLHLLVMRHATADAVEQARAMLSGLQQALPAVVGDALLEAVGAWERGDPAAAAAALRTALAQAPVGYGSASGDLADRLD